MDGLTRCRVGPLASLAVGPRSVPLGILIASSSNKRPGGAKTVVQRLTTVRTQEEADATSQDVVCGDTVDLCRMMGYTTRPRPLFKDRVAAGRALAERLSGYANRDDVMVLALPRGGVPVAYEVAKVLRAPLDVFQVRKLGVPGHEELAMGAIASGGVRIVNDDVVRMLRLPDSVLDSVAEAEEQELRRRDELFRGARPMLDLRNKTVILIDDGLATGSTMRAAVQAIRQYQPARLIVAVPVGATETCNALGAETAVDEVVCAATPEPFHAVGLWYGDFTQTSNEEVIDLLERSRREASPAGRWNPPENAPYWYDGLAPGEVAGAEPEAGTKRSDARRTRSRES